MNYTSFYIACSAIGLIINLGVAYGVYKYISKRRDISRKYIFLWLFLCFLIGAVPNALFHSFFAEVVTVTTDGKLEKDMLFNTQYQIADDKGNEKTEVLDRGQEYIYNNTDRRLMHYGVDYGSGKQSKNMIKVYEAHTLQTLELPLDYYFAKAPESIRVKSTVKSDTKYILDWEEEAIKNLTE